MKTVYGVKFLNRDFTSPFQEFAYEPYMPHDGKPGKWLPPVKNQLEMCKNGYHAAKLDTKAIDHWRVTTMAVLVELRDPLEEVVGTKHCARRMRFLEVLETDALSVSPVALLRKAKKALRRMGVKDVV